MATLLGKVGIVLKGTWSSASTYEILDAVYYSNGLYIAKQNVPANTAPTNTTYWQPAIDSSTLVFDGLNHNGIYRGKNLGTISTTAQLESFLTEHEVSTSKFTDLYLGDYFTIQDGTYNAAWMVAGFGTEANKGNANVLGNNHISLIPRTKVTDARMNATNDTTGAYAGSEMHTTTLPAIVTKLQTVLGTHLKKRNILASDVMTAATASAAGAGLTGASTHWAWTEVYASLLTEVQVYGSTICSSSYYDVGEGASQLPVFKHINHVQNGRFAFWLRAVASSSYFAFASDGGYANYYGASSALSVRPLIVIG